MRINIEYREGQGDITLVVMRGQTPGDTASTMAAADGGRRVGLQTAVVERFSHLFALQLCESELAYEGQPGRVSVCTHSDVCG